MPQSWAAVMCLVRRVLESDFSRDCPVNAFEIAKQERVVLTFVTMTSAAYFSRFHVLYTSLRRWHATERILLWTYGEIPHSWIPSDVETHPLPVYDGALARERPNILLDSFRLGADRLAFLGADMEVFAPLEEADRLLDRYDAVSVPCVIRPIPDDGCFPNTQAYCRIGNLNTDFILLRNTAETQCILRWWKAAVEGHCRDDPASGLCYEHAWFGLWPYLMDGFHIWRTMTHNVCYWNAHLYNLRRANGRWETDGGPLVLFHYSGFEEASPNRLSRYQTRYTVETGDYFVFCREYAERLRSARAALEG
ncbi:hypothetical protein AYO40_00645 [Planctomycetaceae bacterium SCGC AG-212-D15]|nr:hypothetical protein AYO40_00645 [Planctomycetaceae bacterium SCGC AG-212-D15]